MNSVHLNDQVGMFLSMQDRAFFLYPSLLYFWNITGQKVFWVWSPSKNAIIANLMKGG